MNIIENHLYKLIQLIHLNSFKLNDSSRRFEDNMRRNLMKGAALQPSRTMRSVDAPPSSGASYRNLQRTVKKALKSVEKHRKKEKKKVEQT